MLLTGNCFAQQKPEDMIIGKWISEQRNLIINVSRENIDFKATIVWFNDSNCKGTAPMEERLDTKNPNKSLRNRKIIGSNVLRGLTYNYTIKQWENGVIYDATSGKEWQSVAWITKDGKLKIRGYWELEIFGRTMTFIRLLK